AKQTRSALHRSNSRAKSAILAQSNFFGLEEPGTARAKAAPVPERGRISLDGHMKFSVAWERVGGAPAAARPGVDSEQFRSVPKTCRALCATLSMLQTVRASRRRLVPAANGATLCGKRHGRHEAARVHYAARRRRGGAFDALATGGARAATDARDPVSQQSSPGLSRSMSVSAPNQISRIEIGAPGRTRTSTMLPPPDFEPAN